MNKIILLIFCLLSWSLAGSAQKTTALVLSGGGSRGVAHIGVIRALEERGIKIDYVVGTSMGAMIGAMYASGMTADEMEAYFRDNDIQSWINDHIDPMQHYYFMEDDADASMAHLGFNINKEGLNYHLPTNLISGNRLGFELAKMFASSCVAAHHNFDSLMLPYRCVATDIDDGKAMVLKNGSLCNSVRASMTFPFLIDPIKINGKLLFDGGMKNNFPVDVAIQEFHPDFIIGSKAAGNYDAPKEDDLFSIIQNLLSSDVEYTTHGEKGLIIELNLPPVDITDFSYTSALIDSGYVQANNSLQHYSGIDSLPANTANLAQKRTEFQQLKPEFKIDAVYTELYKERRDAYLVKKIRRKKSIASFDDLEKDYFKLAAHPGYKRTLFQLKYNGHKQAYDLFYFLKKEDPFSFDFGGNLSTANITQAYTKIGFQNVSKQRISAYINGYFGQFYRSVKAMARFDISGKIPVSLKISTTYNNKNYFRGKTYFFEDEEPAFLKEHENFLRSEITTPVTTVGKSSLGLIIGTNIYNYYQTNTFSRVDTADETSYEYISPLLTYDINFLNKKQYATHGLLLKVSFHYVDGLERHTAGSTSYQSRQSQTIAYSTLNSYYRFKFEYENYFYHNSRIDLGGKMAFVISNQAFFNNYTSSILAAEQFSPLPESKALFLPQYRAYNYGAAGVIASVNLIKNLSLRLESYYYQPYQRIKSKKDRTAYFEPPLSSHFFIGSSAFIYYTRFGPLSLSFNYYNGTTQPWSLVFGFGYVIFNHSAFE